MSAFLYLPASADSVLVSAVMEAFRADPGVRDAFGTPPRIFFGETRRAIFPFAALERHETEDASFVGAQGRLHRITLTTSSRHGGHEEAQLLVSALSSAAENMQLQLDGQDAVFIHVVYSDVVRPPERDQYRGLLRLKILTRAIAPSQGGA
ncbi:MAG: DUF3168 domain-containing protein [Pseudomonadota bacterium]